MTQREVRAMRLRQSIAKVSAWTGALALLAIVFAAYLRPELALTLATQLWNCF